ncbi:MAG: EAL domain-containing protein [Chloroflexi bacterium]|nr:EAL domain-containing protein [Chloroflexota bacterium]
MIAANALILIGLAVSLAVIVGLVRANRITRALRRLQMTAAAMAAGDLTARVASYADDETGTLGRTFDTMADRLEAMVRDLEDSVVNGLSMLKTAAESEARYRRLVEQAGDGFVVSDPNGRIVAVNATVCALLGYTPNELQDLSLRDVLQMHLLPDGTPPADTDMREAGLRRKDHTLAIVEIRTCLLENGSHQAIIRDITERKRTEEALRHQAMHDLLTGLPNRVLLYDRLRKRTTSPLGQTALSLLVIDLDGFKEINDTFGHQYGDSLLTQVGQRWQAVLHESDTLARLGGDEFAVLLASTGDVEGASLVALRLQQALEDAFIVLEERVNIGASIGIALFPEDGSDAEALLRCADVAMYSAKRSGRACAAYEASHDHNSVERLALVGELRRAIEEDELVLHFQPQVDLQTGRIVAAEALVRWQHPRRGLLGPNEFIPLAERVMLIEPLTQWVLNAALRENRAWQAAGRTVPVAVNLSMRSFQDPYLPEIITGLLARWEVAPSSLRLEITESSLMADPAEAIEVISRLRAMGLRVAVDDFGTGYASLAYLKRLPVDELKMDKSFVGGMATDGKDLAIVRSTIALAHELGLQVVAEGVEDGATWDLLTQAGCDLAQGHYISRPVSAAALFGQLGDSVMLREAACFGKQAA